MRALRCGRCSMLSERGSAPLASCGPVDRLPRHGGTRMRGPPARPAQAGCMRRELGSGQPRHRAAPRPPPLRPAPLPPRPTVAWQVLRRLVNTPAAIARRTAQRTLRSASSARRRRAGTTTEGTPTSMSSICFSKSAMLTAAKKDHPTNWPSLGSDNGNWLVTAATARMASQITGFTRGTAAFRTASAPATSRSRSTWECLVARSPAPPAALRRPPLLRHPHPPVDTKHIDTHVHTAAPAADCRPRAPLTTQSATRPPPPPPRATTPPRAPTRTRPPPAARRPRTPPAGPACPRRPG